MSARAPFRRSAMLLVLVLLAPAAAAASGDGDASPARDEATDQMLAGTEHLDPLAALREVDADDPATLMAAVRANLERAGAPIVLAFEEITDGRLFDAGPAGDLTGNGAEDVLAIVIEDGTYRVEMQVLDGSDGSTAWVVAFPDDIVGVVVVEAGDQDGDGAEDLFLLTLRLPVEVGAGLPFCIVGAGAATILWELSVLSGPTGVPIWQQTTSGAGAAACAGLLLLVGAARASLMLFEPIPDRDGNGAPELLVNTYERADPFVTDVVLDTTTIVDARDGSVLQTLASAAVGTVIVVGVSDAVGDATADLARIIETGPPWMYALTLTFEMIDGSTLETAWIDMRPGFIWQHIPIGDSDGDGRADILLIHLYTVVVPELGTAVDWHLLSGASGAERWVRPRSAPYYWVDFDAGPIGGAPGSDILFIDASSYAGGRMAEVYRVDGGTGLTLFSTRRDFSGTNMQFLPQTVNRAAVDVDGDGVEDASYDMRSYPYWTDHVIESGLGGDIYAARTDGRCALMLPIADLDGDGDVDHLLGASPPDCAVRPYTQPMVEGPVLLPDPVRLWERSSVAAWYAVWESPRSGIGDLSGDGLPDILFVELFVAAWDDHVVEARAGLTGDVLWTRSW